MGELEAGHDFHRDKRPRPGWRRWVRRVWRVIWILLVFVPVLAVTALYLAFETHWGRELLRKVAVSQLNLAWPGSIEVGALLGAPWRELGLRDVRLYSPEGALLVGFDALDVRVDLWALRANWVRIRSVRLLGVTGQVLDSEGRVAALAALPPSTPAPAEAAPPEPSGWVISIEDAALSISDLALSPEGPLRLESAEILASAYVGPERIVWRLSELAAVAKGLPFSTLRLDGEGSLEGSSLVLGRHHALVGPHRLSLACALNLDTMDGSVSVSDLFVDLAAIPDLSLLGGADGALWAHMEKGAVTAGLAVLTDAGRIAAKGSAALLPTLGHAALELWASGLRPHEIMPELPAEWGGSVILKAEGRGNPLQEGAASAVLKVLGPQGPVPLPRTVTVQANLDGGSGSVDFRLDGPDRAWAEGAVTAGHWVQGPWSASLAAAGVQAAMFSQWVEPWGVSGRIGAIEAVASAVRVPDGPERHGLTLLEQLSGQANVSLSVRDVAVEQPEPASLAAADIDVSVKARGPATVQSGKVQLTARALQGYGGSADALRVDWTLSEVEDGLRVLGPISADGWSYGAQAAGTKARIRLDATIGGTDRIRAALNISATGTSALENKLRVAQFGGRFDATWQLGLLPYVALKGEWLAQDLRWRRQVRVARFRGDIDARLAAGSISGETGLDVADAHLPGGRHFRTLSFAGTLARKREVSARLQGQGPQLDVLADARVFLPTRKDPKGEVRVGALRVVEREEGVEFAPGLYASWTSAGDLEVRDLRVEGIGLPGTVSAGGEYHRRGNRFSGGLKVEAVEIESWHRWALAAAGLPADPEQLLRGRLDLVVDGKGTLREPEFGLDLTIQRGRVGPVDGILGRASARLERGTLKTDVRLGWPGGGRILADIDAPISLRFKPWTLDWPLDSPYRVHVDAGPIELSWLGSLGVELGPVSLEGQVALSVHGEGTRSDPVFDAKLETTRPRVRQWVPDRLAVTAKLDAERATVGLEVVEPAARSNGAARGIELSAAGPADPIRRVVRGEELGDWRRDLELSPAVIAVNAASLDLARVTRALGGTALEPLLVGRLDGNLDIEAGWSSLKTSGALIARGLHLQDRDATLRLAGAPASEGRGALEFTGTSADRPLGTVWLALPANIVELLASGGLDAAVKDPGLELVADLDQLDEEWLSLLVPGAAAGLSAVAPQSTGFGRLAVAGSPAGLRGLLSARLFRNRERAGSAGGAFRGVEVSAQLEPDRTDLRAVLWQDSEGGAFSVTGSVPVGSQAALSGALGHSWAAVPLQARLQSHELSVGTLAKGLPAILGGSEGALRAAVDVSGTLGAPSVEGRIDLEFEPLVAPVLGWRTSATALALEFSKDGLRLLPVRIEQGAGALELELGVAWPTFNPADMAIQGSLKMDNFTAANRNDARVVTTARLEFGGTVERPSLEGDLTLVEGVLRPELEQRSLHRIALPTDVVFMDGLPPQLAGLGERIGEVEGLMPLDLDVRISIPSRALRVRNSLVDLLLGGSLAARTRNRLLALEGRVQVDEGRVLLYGRRFQVREGSEVIFDGRTEINPRLSIRAEYDISAVDLSAIGLSGGSNPHILITVGGSATEPTLALSSEPAMDETNIVSVIVTGAPVDTGGGASESGSVLESQTLNLFAGLATGTLSQLVEGELPIDVFQVETRGDSMSSAKVRVGKRLSRDLLVTYVANVGGSEEENANEVLVEYRLIRDIRLLTRVGDAGVGNASLVWTWSK